MMDWQTVLVSFTASIVVAIITAITTTLLAYRKFRAERWWEMRHEAYESLFESLSYSASRNDQLIFENLGVLPQRKMTPEEMYTRMDKTRNVFLKAELRLSKDVCRLINEYLDNFQDIAVQFAKRNAQSSEKKQGSNIELFNAVKKHIEDFLPKLREAARKDLRSR